MASNEVVWSESSFVNSRGNKIYTQQWVRQDAKAVIVLIHGYGDHSHWLIKASAEKYAYGGVSSFAFDQEGHGKSEGLPAYVQTFDHLVEDSISYIEYAKSLHPNLNCYIHGGSMGGAIVLLVALKRPDLISGIILASPMIKVADSAKPPPLVIRALKSIAYVFPTLPIVPKVNVIDLAFREEKDRETARNNPLGYKGRVRLGTGLAILDVTEYLQANIKNITLPMLIVHGTGDLVTSYESSVDLYKTAKSTDKTLKLYEGMWHVLSLEPICAKIDDDIKDWLTARVNAEIVCDSMEMISAGPKTETVELNKEASKTEIARKVTETTLEAKAEIAQEEEVKA